MTPSCCVTTAAFSLIHADAAHSSLPHSLPSMYHHLYLSLSLSNTISVSQGVIVTAVLLQMG